MFDSKLNSFTHPELVHMKTYTVVVPHDARDPKRRRFITIAVVRGGRRAPGGKRPAEGKELVVFGASVFENDGTPARVPAPSASQKEGLLTTAVGRLRTCPVVMEVSADARKKEVVAAVTKAVLVNSSNVKVKGCHWKGHPLLADYVTEVSKSIAFITGNK